MKTAPRFTGATALSRRVEGPADRSGRNQRQQYPYLPHPVLDESTANFLAINLAHDIVADGKAVDEARQEYATTMVKIMMGGNPDYTQGLQFGAPTRDVRDPDESIITDAMKEKVKEMMGIEGGRVEAEEE